MTWYEPVVCFTIPISKQKLIHQTNSECSLIWAIFKTFSPQWSWDYNTISINLRSWGNIILWISLRGNSFYYCPHENSILICILAQIVSTEYIIISYTSQKVQTIITYFCIFCQFSFIVFPFFHSFFDTRCTLSM